MTCAIVRAPIATTDDDAFKLQAQPTPYLVN